MAGDVWTVRAAKARLSELLRLAKEDGPQRIGERESYIVITAAEWERLNAPKPHLGTWLLIDHHRLKRGRSEPLPARHEHPVRDDQTAM